ncbi:flagellar hook protein FlgE [Devosia submarina]|uniref:flagellar hook protein FlgE n=1 Tax=Devosia submarina TaxID=1173082 RepID=UPI000D368039|nr:flagellar hook-basal body complex protein [Devosia submarina]
MGIYGALSAAVTGLRAQSHALENISGNIANSQTTGYKRIETDFLDLIPDAPLKRQVPGAVIAQSRSTNDVQGDIKTVSNETFIALNGNGFFVVEPKVGQADGSPVFAGTNFYTRRGDFQIDKDGYLVNGAGYYLKGLEVDKTTGNISGSVPGMIQLSNNFLAANQTQVINYQANLPQLPKTDNYNPNVKGSELMGSGATLKFPLDLDADDLLGKSVTLTINGETVEYKFIAPTDPTPPPAEGIKIVNIESADSIESALVKLADQVGTDKFILLPSGGISLPAGSRVETEIAGIEIEEGPAALVPTISKDREPDFLRNTISGGAITVYGQNGAPANVQMRWAKVSSASPAVAEDLTAVPPISASPATVDKWHLFYMSDSNAAGANAKWTKVDADFTFGANGALTSPNGGEINIEPLTVNGVSIDKIKLRYNTTGLSQFADVNGTVNVSMLNQDGYGAGEFVSVAINDNGRVVATYSNGERLDVAQVVTAQFNATNQLKRLDGGVFSATSESGEAILDLAGSGVIGGALEASNTDISDEFTKLIVTQQAYAASTRIVSSADEMLQEALNMVR